MTGIFNGITDKEWNLLKFYVPKKKTNMGRPYRSFREIFNSMTFVLIEGIRWSSLPRGSRWAPKSTTHFWLGKLEQSGAFQMILHWILSIAKNLKAVDLSTVLIDGSFVPGKGGGDSVKYGYKGKGSTVHLLVDRNGMPIVHITTAANDDERQQVMKLLQNKAIPRDTSLQKCHADKGYDAQWLRDALLNIGITPAIPYRIIGKEN